MSTARMLAIAELLISCSTHVYSLSHAEGLTPAQWAALRYFASANAGAANLASFVTHHGTTKGTASRTVSRLVQRDLLVRTQDGLDKRRQIIQVTKAGTQLLLKDPVYALAASIEASKIDDVDAFAEAIVRLIQSSSDKSTKDC